MRHMNERSMIAAQPVVGTSQESRAHSQKVSGLADVSGSYV